MGKVSLEIGPDPRLKRKIMRLAVALPEPSEDAEDLRVPLGSEHFVMRPEGLPILDVGSRDVTVQHRLFERGRHIPPGILRSETRS
jgi:hypothetical protein